MPTRRRAKSKPKSRLITGVTARLPAAQSAPRTAMDSRLRGNDGSRLTTTRKRPAGKMNQLERDYAARLRLLQMAGEIDWFAFEPLAFQVGNDCRYTPDFGIRQLDGTMEFHETKGFWRDDARVKIRVAAEMYWMFRFRGVTRKQRRGVTTWTFEDFEPRAVV